MRNELEPLATYSETEAQRILARAAELEEPRLEATIGTRFTTEDLRQIAMKAGIDSQALEHAMNESDAVATPAVSDELPPLMKPSRFAILAGIGAVLGALAVVADKMPLPGSSAIEVFLPSALVAIYMASRHPLREGFIGLLRELGILFGSFTATIIALQGFQGASPAMAWALFCGALGSGILSVRGARTDNPVADTAAIDAR